MECELTHKKNHKSISLFLICILVCSLFCSCDLRYGKYPSDIAAQWTSETPHLALTYSVNSNGEIVTHEELEFENELIAVDILFGLGDYCVYPINSSAYKDRLFSGRWKYRKGNLVLIIKEDFIFENQYSEIVLAPSYPN